jgi:hypothetical protein
MSIFGNIMSSIFGRAQAQTSQAAPTTAQVAPSGAAKTSTPSSAGATSSASSAPISTNVSSSPKNAAPTVVDVEAVLTQLASQNKEKLDWRSSIVDLMKLLNLDSSLSARKELAGELHYTGDTNDSAKMNIWLHKQVMVKLAENGGKVPDSLKG